jgi:hypothetical protein
VTLTPPPGNPRSHADLQALADAIRYREARLSRPCRICRPGRPCGVHVCDLRLLDRYREMIEAAIARRRDARLARTAVSAEVEQSDSSI